MPHRKTCFLRRGEGDDDVTPIQRRKNGSVCLCLEEGEKSKIEEEKLGGGGGT